DRDVHHEAGRRRSMPVVLTGREVDAIAGADDLDRTAIALAETDAFGHEERLPERVRVPCGPRAGREVHHRRRGSRRRRWTRDRVDVDVAREPVAWGLGGIE